MQKVVGSSPIIRSLSLLSSSCSSPLSPRVCVRKGQRLTALVPDLRDSCFGHLATRGMRRGMTGDGGEEDIASQRVQLRVDGRLDGRGPRNVTQQCDLAEVIARIGNGLSARGVDGEFAVVHNIEAIP